MRGFVFRWHGFSLLALAKGMSTLFAKNGFSRPSLEQFCGVFRHVLFPQDKEGYGSITSHEENCFVFLRSHHPPLTRTNEVVDANFCTRTTIANGANGSKCKTSGGNTRRLLGEKRHR